MPSLFDELRARGCIAQTTDEVAVRRLLDEGPVTFYIGFDPTADSLHVGHFLQLVTMKRLQDAGHRPIVLLGGGTAMVGDPSGKTDMRRMLSREEIAANTEAFRRQIGRFIDFSDDRALFLDNADWLLPLRYIPFLRDIGVHFTVNRMLAAECFKSRMEKGLSFLEFNYMLMQAYDFLHLYRTRHCRLQIGGDDQWSNILAGADLVRRTEGAEVHGLTLPLLTTASGQKMGKTEKGAVWLDPAKTPPYDLFQYWRNIDDRDVGRCLGLLTFLPMDEVRRLSGLKDAEINHAKTVLAYEITRMVHGPEEADKALQASQALFGRAEASADAPEISGIPLTHRIIDFLVASGACPSKSEARRLVEGGGVSVNGIKVASPAATMADFPANPQGVRILQVGKRHRWVVRTPPSPP